MSESKKFLLQECDIPTAWYNVIPAMPVKPRPMLNPATKQPLTAEDLFPLFSEEAARQEMNFTDSWIEIPEESATSTKYGVRHLWCVPVALKKRSTHLPASISRTRA